MGNPRVNKTCKICFISSGGGHFKQLCNLAELGDNRDIFLISTKENRLLADLCPFERTYLISDVGTGYWKKQPDKFVGALFTIFKVFLRERPDVLISTGSGIAVPGFIVAKIFGIKTIYIEAYARVTSLSVTGKICYILADLFIVQHPELLEKAPRAKYGGSLYLHLPGDNYAVCNCG